MEYVILVDKNDKEIGKKEKLQAHIDGNLHRAFSIMLYRINNNQLQIMLQKRSMEKYHTPGLWANSCCSHPRVNEDLQSAANRRLQEELGISTQLVKSGSFVYKANLSDNLIEHEYDHVFIGRYDSDNLIVTNPQEIMDLKWFDYDFVKKDLDYHPEKYVPWLTYVMSVTSEFYDNLYC